MSKWIHGTIFLGQGRSSPRLMRQFGLPVSNFSTEEQRQQLVEVFKKGGVLWIEDTSFLSPETLKELRKLKVEVHLLSPDTHENFASFKSFHQDLIDENPDGYINDARGFKAEHEKVLSCIRSAARKNAEGFLNVRASKLTR